ncbi:MAG TPA: hypothetical protein VGN09_17645, partial [Vicinamibacteria bacterium]
MGHAPPRFTLFAAVVVLTGIALLAETPRGLETQREACQRLEQAAEAAARGRRGDFARLLEEAARRMESLAKEAALAPELKRELTTAAAELRGRAASPPAGFSAQASLRLLERVAAALGASSGELAFQGSYSQTKVQEPAYGGHASAMGPPPEAPPLTGGPSPVQFEEVPGLSEKTFCGGRTKDSILESGGSG